MRSIVLSIVAAAPDLVDKIEEAERQAKIARQEAAAAQERGRREDDQKRIEQSRRDSKEQLAQIIQQWSQVMSVEGFLAGVERQAERLDANRRDALLERLRLARTFLGSQDPVDFFLSWATPEERYQSRYNCPEHIAEV